MDDHSHWKLLLWLAIMSTGEVAQGGLGACAFLGTSVIMKGAIVGDVAPQETIDLTDRNFLIIRVILGTLFGVLLGLPFSPFGLNGFKEVYWTGKIAHSESNVLTSLIPFLAGFSTNLVLVVLGKFIVPIETVFRLSNRN
jgi:hypothetical protein